MSLLANELRKLGLDAEDIAGGLVKIADYPVTIGRHRGEKVTIAVSGADFPFTPPAGVHIDAPWGADRPNVSVRPPFEPNGRYFSRTLPGWTGKNKIHLLLAYINKVLGDA